MDKLKSIIKIDHLNKEEQEQIDKLLNKHSDRFQLEGDNFTATNITKHRFLTWEKKWASKLGNY